MNLEPSEEQKAIVAQVRRFAQSHIEWAYLNRGIFRSERPNQELTRVDRNTVKISFKSKNTKIVGSGVRDKIEAPVNGTAQELDERERRRTAW